MNIHAAITFKKHSSLFQTSKNSFVQIVGLCVFELPPCKGKLDMRANDLQLSIKNKNVDGCQSEHQGKTHSPLTFYK